ncbi:MAG TPA: LanC-like protein [Gaiellaceae bacterium]|nr:LanC-like protein [Gaiellaceae bacterium]
MLYEPEAHEPLTDETWDPGRVAGGIRAIVADADAAFDPDALWPADEWDVWEATPPMKDLYVGASGVVWALDALRRRGHAETTLDLTSAARRVLEAWHQTPDYAQWDDVPSQAPAALLMGESGPLLAAWRVESSADLADRLFARVRENVDNEAVEIMWGAPGTMLAARAMLDWTGEERWADAWRDSAEALWKARDPDGLWTNRLYGETFRSLGPPHGLVGNVLALRAGGLLAPERVERLEQETAAILERLALTEDGLANWPRREDTNDEALRLQWCNGAPGIVAATADYLDEELLLAGAELTWQAGSPGMDKGSSLCHGTAGNGYAFLKAFERTGDERWLERARHFAVHALEQVAHRGRGRYSLWTGDVGVALYAADCLGERSAYPIIDSL